MWKEKCQCSHGIQSVIIPIHTVQLVRVKVGSAGEEHEEHMLVNHFHYVGHVHPLHLIVPCRNDKTMPRLRGVDNFYELGGLKIKTLQI